MPEFDDKNSCGFHKHIYWQNTLTNAYAIMLFAFH